MLIIVFVVIAAVALLVRLAKQSVDRPAERTPGGEAPFLLDAKPYFFSQAENRFYTELSPVAQALDLCVFPKVGLNDIFKDRKEAKPGQGSRYGQMHVDFLLVTRKDYKPVLGIELDGSSHQAAKQQERDQKKSAVFRAARIPLLRFNNSDKATEREIRAKLEEALGRQPARR
jgi:hypothetical protein